MPLPLLRASFATFLKTAGLSLALSLPLLSCHILKPAPESILRRGFADLNAKAETVISDRARRESYLQYSRQMEAEFLDFEAHVAGFVRDYRRAFTDYDIGEQELTGVVEDFRDRQRSAQDRFVELHLAMAATVTAEEWPPLSRQEAKIIESLLDNAMRRPR